MLGFSFCPGLFYFINKWKIWIFDYIFWFNIYETFDRTHASDDTSHIICLDKHKNYQIILRNNKCQEWHLNMLVLFYINCIMHPILNLRRNRFKIINSSTSLICCKTIPLIYSENYVLCIAFVFDWTLCKNICLFWQKLNFSQSYIHGILPFFNASSKALDWELYTQSGEL